MRVPKLSEPVSRQRLYRDRGIVQRRLPAINMSQEEALLEGDITNGEEMELPFAEEEGELPFDLAENGSELSSALEEGAVGLE